LERCHANQPPRRLISKFKIILLSLHPLSRVFPHLSDVTSHPKNQIITHYGQEQPVPLLQRQSLFLVSRHISLEAHAILYGSNKFMLETPDSIPDIQHFLIEIARTNRSVLCAVSIDFCRAGDSQAHFATWESIFYQVRMPSDSDATPKKLRAALQNMERILRKISSKLFACFPGPGIRISRT
jgi:hypothetical protein